MSFIDQLMAARGLPISLFGGNNRVTTPPINPNPNISTLPDGGYGANLLPTGGVRPQVDVGLMGKKVLNAVSRARDALATPKGFEEAGREAAKPVYSFQKSLRPHAATWRPDVKNNQAIRKIVMDDPIIGGIIQAESAGGRAKYKSRKGAKGIMQLMPNTYGRTKDIKASIKAGSDIYKYGHGMYGKWLDENQVANPEENVKFGAEYYNKLKQDKTIGNGSDRQALIAYNWGPKNYRKWKSRGGKESQLPPETRDYLAEIEKVMNKKLR